MNTPKKGDSSVLYNLFIRAPWLGSLIDPRSAEGCHLIEHGFADLEP